MIDFIYRMLARAGITKHHDKVIHFIAGVIVGAVAMATLPHDFIPYPVVALAVIATGKEVYDKYIKDTEADFFDFFATICGGFVGIVGCGVLM